MLSTWYRIVQHLKTNGSDWRCVRPFVPSRGAPILVTARALSLCICPCWWAGGAAPLDELPTPMWVPLFSLNTSDASLFIPRLSSFCGRSVPCAAVPSPPHTFPHGPLPFLPGMKRLPPPPRDNDERTHARADQVARRQAVGRGQAHHLSGQELHPRRAYGFACGSS